MKVKLSFKDKTSINPSSPSRRKVAVFLRERTAKNGVFEGHGYVEYKPGYRNEFDFSSKQELEDKLWPCLEKELIDEFK